jgi:hypothetical protein
MGFVMAGYRPPPHDFGLSWGMRGFRVGRSQYGTWWVSVQLPFGFRITRRLGRLRDHRSHLTAADVVGDEGLPAISALDAVTPSEPVVVSRNQEILARMKGKQS